MRTFINILTCVGALIAVSCVIYLFYGLSTDAFSDGAGMAILAIQMWALIGALIALVSGYIGRYRAIRMKLPASRISTMGILIGLIGGLSVFAFPFL